MTTKEVMNVVENDELIFMLHALCLKYLREKRLEDAINCPTTGLLNPSQIPQQRDFTSQPLHPLNRPLSPSPGSSNSQIPQQNFPSQPLHSLNRPLLPLPGSPNLQIPQQRDFPSQPLHPLNRLLPLPGSPNLQLPKQRDFLSQALHPFNHPLFPFPGDDLTTNNFQYQLSRAGDEENIYHTIIQEHESRQLINKVRYLKDSNTPESKLEIQYIIQGLASNPISLCLSACNRIGSYALQQLIKIIKKSAPEMSQLTLALSIEFCNIACDLIGRHVILKCFKKLSLCDNKILYIEMGKHCLRLATDEAGCALLNDCIPLMCTTYKNPILEQIAINCQSLAQDCYGTYVVQQAITNQHPNYTPMIVNKLRVLILSLSTQKAGSHLVEKCLKYSSTKHIVMEELVKLNTLQLRDLACHEYGNFVIQQAISPIQDEQSSMVQMLTRMLRQTLCPILRDLQTHKIGRNVYKRYKETQQMLRAVHDPLVDC